MQSRPTGRRPSHSNYVSHHNGAQYFGYLANNPAEERNLRGENDFFTDMAKNALPRTGGVFYIRGGYYNLNYPKRTAIIQNPNYPNKNGLTAAEIAAINVAKSGDDDNPPIPTASSPRPSPSGSCLRIAAAGATSARQVRRMFCRP